MPAHIDRSITVFCAAIAGVFIATSASAFDKTCEEEMPEIKALIDQMPHDADRNTALHQYGKAQEKLAEGNERRCLLYLESARGAIDADQMHDN